MPDRPHAFLGQYLVGKGLITAAQLDDAIRLQKESTRLVGAIALDQGFLNASQLRRLVGKQAREDIQLGELALREGLMHAGQLQTVLAIQGRNHLYLGESLVRLGTLSRPALVAAVREFEAQIAGQEQRIRGELSHLPMAVALQTILDVTLRFFYRLGFPMHIVGHGRPLPDYVSQVFYAEQVFRKQGVQHLGLGMGGVLVESIAQGATRRDRFDGSSPGAVENMAQLLFNLNYMVCRKMSAAGMRVKHGAVVIGTAASSDTNVLCVDLVTVTNPLVLLYSPDPPPLTQMIQDDAHLRPM